MTLATKNLSVLFLSCILAANSLTAADIRKVQIGDLYYIYKLIGDNDRVVVRDVDFQSNRVKVAHLKSGGVDWVEPSVLMTESESNGADTGTHVAGAILGIEFLYCLANPDECSTQQISRHAESRDQNVQITLINEHCNNVDYYVEGQQVASGVAPNSWRRFPAHTGQHRVWACNSGTNACSQAESVTWSTNCEVRIVRGASCNGAGGR